MFDRGHRRIEKLITRLTRSKEHPNEIYPCPECGGQLHVQFEAYKRNEQRMLGARAWCDTCHLAVSIDCGEPLPLWLSNTDNQLSTRLRPRPPTNR
jgi:hypothetical protein